MDVDKQNTKLYDEFCKTKTISESRSETLKPVGRNGSLIVSLPVVVSRTKVHINVESRIALDRRALEIRDCKKDVFLTHCSLLDLGNAKFGKIYMDGHIRESIEYVDGVSTDKSKFTGIVRFTTVRVPFECISRVEYFVSPRLKVSNCFIPVELNTNNIVQRGPYRPVEQMQKMSSGLGGLLCELEDIKIQESGMEKKLPNANGIGDRRFIEITENMTVSITYILMQRQLVSVNKY